MATFATIETQALRSFSPRATDKVNFGDDELLVYANAFLREVSEGLADIHARLARTTASLSFATAATTAAMPTDFLAMETVFKNGTSTKLNMASNDEIDNYEGSTASGIPFKWYALGGTFYVYPKPNASFTVKVVYYPLKSIAAITDQIPWSGVFDLALQLYLLKRMRLRAEMFSFAQADEVNYQRALAKAYGRVSQQDDFTLRPARGWTNAIGNRRSGPYYYNDPPY